MMTEKDYCDYDTCVALKELGYKVPTSAYYMPNNNQLILVLNQFRGGAAMDCFYSNNSLPKECMESDFIDAPTMWEAQKWLREEKGIYVVPELGLIHRNKTSIIHYYRVLVKNMNNGIIITLDNDRDDFESYEEALLEGIKEAVKLLKEEK